MNNSLPPGPDALLPNEMAIQAEEIGVKKGKLDLLSLLMLAVLAGAFIALGAVFSAVAMTGGGQELHWGLSRVLAGSTFSLGLILVVVAGAELFTGNCLLVMAVVSGRLGVGSMLRNWGVVYLGNMLGALMTATVVFLAAQHEMAEGQVGLTLLQSADAKCGLGFVEAFARGLLCNALVCLAVWLCLSCRTTTDKVLAVVFPITAFVAAGFEHCVANMFLVPLALFVQEGASVEFWNSIGATPAGFQNLDWGSFLASNLVPVTLGNIVGGVGFVGLVYWVIYRRSP